MDALPRPAQCRVGMVGGRAQHFLHSGFSFSGRARSCSPTTGRGPGPASPVAAARRAHPKDRRRHFHFGKAVCSRTVAVVAVPVVTNIWPAAITGNVPMFVAKFSAGRRGRRGRAARCCVCRWLLLMLWWWFTARHLQAFSSEVVPLLVASVGTRSVFTAVQLSGRIVAENRCVEVRVVSVEYVSARKRT